MDRMGEHEREPMPRRETSAGVEGADYFVSFAGSVSALTAF
jgi:hypothetical protein